MATDELPPVCRWGKVAQSGMPSQQIVKHIDVFADVSNRYLPGAILPEMNQFRLESTEETFHQGVVITVPLAVH